MFFILGKDLADSGGCKAGCVGVKTAAKGQLATAGVQAWDGLEAVHVGGGDKAVAGDKTKLGNEVLT